MFCPNCSANNSSEQKFCRSCGLNLEKSAASLLEQIPSAKTANLIKYEKSLDKFGNVAFGGFALALLVGVVALIYTIFNRMILPGSNVIGGSLLIALIIFGTLLLAYVVLRENLNEQKQKINPPLAKDLPEKLDTGKLLEEKVFEPASSVTENSTELLFVENKTRKL